MVLYQLLF